MIDANALETLKTINTNFIFDGSLAENITAKEFRIAVLFSISKLNQLELYKCNYVTAKIILDYTNLYPQGTSITLNGLATDVLLMVLNKLKECLNITAVIFTNLTKNDMEALKIFFDKNYTGHDQLPHYKTAYDDRTQLYAETRHDKQNHKKITTFIYYPDAIIFTLKEAQNNDAKKQKLNQLPDDQKSTVTAVFPEAACEFTVPTKDLPGPIGEQVRLRHEWYRYMKLPIQTIEPQPIITQPTPQPIAIQQQTNIPTKKRRAPRTKAAQPKSMQTTATSSTSSTTSSTSSTSTAEQFSTPETQEFPASSYANAKRKLSQSNKPPAMQPEPWRSAFSPPPMQRQSGVQPTLRPISTGHIFSSPFPHRLAPAESLVPPAYNAFAQALNTSNNNVQRYIDEGQNVFTQQEEEEIQTNNTTPWNPTYRP